MSLETRITEAAQAAVRRIDEDLRGRLAALTDELTATATTVGAEVEAAHATTTAELSQRIEDLSADLARRDQRLADLEEQLARDREAQARQVAAMRDEAVRQASLQNEQGRASALLESSRLARQDVATHVQALAHAVSGMDEATTLSEVLDALAEGLASQAPRSAVLVFQESRARIWRRQGFPADAPGIGADLHLPDHTDLTAILDSARPAIVEADGDEPVLGLAALPDGHQGLAVPVAIGGQAAALVYADGGDDPQALPPGWSDAVEVLARHAARCLETLTAMRAAGYARARKPAVVVPMPPHLRVVQRPTLETSMGDALEQAQRVARLLVSEIRLNREADVMAGRAAGDLGTRLSDDIERARRQYRQRVPEAVPGRDALFDEELVRTLANGDATLLRTGS
jgi:hypothetical protein